MLDHAPQRTAQIERVTSSIRDLAETKAAGQSIRTLSPQSVGRRILRAIVEMPDAQDLASGGNLAGPVRAFDLGRLKTSPVLVLHCRFPLGQAPRRGSDGGLFEKERMKESVEFGMPIGRRCQCRMRRMADACDGLGPQEAHRIQEHHHLLMRKRKAMGAQEAGEIHEESGGAGKLHDAQAFSSNASSSPAA